MDQLLVETRLTYAPEGRVRFSLDFFLLFPRPRLSSPLFVYFPS